jgi:5-formyltetrahydrofolate cyclo-ligase
MLNRWRKARVRKAATAARKAAWQADPNAGRRLASHFPDSAWPSVGTVVGGYRPIRDEIDPTPLMETFFCEQARLCLPCVVAPDAPLVFRAYEPGDLLVRGTFNVEEPSGQSPECRPLLILAPLLAFDEAGRRIGYGAGFYDRTIEALRRHHPVTVIGLAYEAQRVKTVPVDRHDVALDWIVTEERAYRGAI